MPSAIQAFVKYREGSDLAQEVGSCRVQGRHRTGNGLNDVLKDESEMGQRSGMLRQLVSLSVFSELDWVNSKQNRCLKKLRLSLIEISFIRKSKPGQKDECRSCCFIFVVVKSLFDMIRA